jgi:hypothetical protein
VLEQDQSVIVARAAERAADAAKTPAEASPAWGAGDTLASAATRRRNERAAAAAGPSFEVTSVAVLPADEEPLDAVDGEPGEAGEGGAIAAELFPGIRDEHDDDGGWQARWLDRPTWDRSVTPNIRRRTGQRPGRRGPRRGY